MPSRPRSSVSLAAFELRRDARLMNSFDVATFGVLSNTRTEPVFCTTYQRELSPGACSIAMVWRDVAVGARGNVRFGNTRCTAMLTVLLGGSPARQVVFAGRASRPEVPPTGGVALVIALAAADAAETLAGVA